MDEVSMRCGLLLETAQNHQDLVESALRELREHAHGLDDVVRAEIRRTLVDELGTVIHESALAVNALQVLQRRARMQSAASMLATGLLAAAVTAWVCWRWLPRPAEIDALRERRDRLAAQVELLERHTAPIDLRRCGSEQRWCVRIDRQAPAYGTDSDYRIVKGE
jgi:hypothetical protein